MFREPRVDCPVDLEAHIKRLLPDAACKGIFVRDLFAIVAMRATPAELATRAGVPYRRYMPFFDYPMAENLRLCFEAAKALHPDKPVAVGLRELGRTAFRAFLSSTPARILMAVVGAGEVDKVLLLTPKSYALSINYGRVDAQLVHERCVHITLSDFPSFIESYQVGIFEGVLDHFEVKGSVRIALTDIANAVIEVKWNPQVSQHPPPVWR